MTKNVFSVPVFFIILRETIEAGIVISILLSFVSQLTKERVEQLGGVTSDDTAEGGSLSSSEKKDGDATALQGTTTLQGSQDQNSSRLTNAQLLRKLRIQVWAGAITGFVIALSIGGAFIGVFYSNKVKDLWSKSEEIWEGTFNLIASFIIVTMGVAFLRLEQSKVKWQIKLAHAFEKSTGGDGNRGGRTSRWALFLLPFITVMREGLEAVVFAGGVSLSASASSIPLAVVVGIIGGVFVSLLIYKSASRMTLHIFLVISTSILLLIGAGLFSSACGYFQTYVFARGVGSDVSEVGTGPGSFDVNGNVWHLVYGSPEFGPNKGGGWSIFKAILGWDNNATLGTILCYVFYWLFVVGLLIYMKWSEGRTTFLGIKSKAYRERHAAALEQRSVSPQTPGDEKDPRTEIV